MEKLVFIGSGSMAEAIIAGLIKNKIYSPNQIFVTNRSNTARLLELKEKYGITYGRNDSSFLQNATTIILSVKPQDIPSVLQLIKNDVKENQLVISLAAGVMTKQIEKEFEQKISVVRAMPNTSATIGRSMTALSKGKFANRDHLERSEKLFSAIGKTLAIEEDKMHVVTAISGSGPAYFYYFMEAMENVARVEGLNPEEIRLLISETIIGAGEMFKQTEQNAQFLREKVTSPGGTTEAALKVFKTYHFQEAIEEGIKEAIKRSRELGRQK